MRTGEGREMREMLLQIQDGVVDKVLRKRLVPVTSPAPFSLLPLDVIL